MEILQYILGVLVIVVGLLLSIGLHEVGHLVPAKRFGVYVSKYMIGLGPTLWSRKFGETEYGVKAIPLGGFIAMAGMFPPARGAEKASRSRSGFFRAMMQDARTASAESVPQGDENRAFYRLAIGKRIIIMLGGPTMNLIIGIVLYAVIICGFGVAQASTTVGSVSQCVLPVTSQRQTCRTSDPVAPAAAAGVLPGDKLLSIDGTAITSWNQATNIIRASPNEKLSIVVERKGADVTLFATPSLDERYVVAADGTVAKDANGKSKTQEVGFMGIGAASETVPQPPAAILPAVATNISLDAVAIATLPQRVVALAQTTFGAQKRDPNGLVGVVGIGRLAGEIASTDTFPLAGRIELLLSVLASLNIGLFMFNLIPLLPLDGGHVAGALWEGIRRFFAKRFARKDPGPVDIAKLIPLTFTVVTLLIGLTVFLVIADIVKPVTLQ